MGRQNANHVSVHKHIHNTIFVRVCQSTTLAFAYWSYIDPHLSLHWKRNYFVLVFLLNFTVGIFVLF